MAYLLEFFIDLWSTTWEADARLHGPRRSPWPWIVTGVAVTLLVIVVVLEGMGKLPW